MKIKYTTLLTVSVFLTALACASNYTWQKPGGTPEAARQAVADCQVQREMARSSAYGSYGHRYEGYGERQGRAHRAGNSVFNSCMRAKGYKKVPLAAPPKRNN